MTQRLPGEIMSEAERREFLRRMLVVAEDHADGRISDSQAKHELQTLIAPVKRRARRWARQRAAGEA